MSRISLITPHILGNEFEYVKDAFKSNWLAPLGPYVEKFENKIKETINVEGAVATCSGTSAIHLGLKCLGVTKDDIVFCPDLTFIASANPILYECAKPVFIDSEEDTGCMSPKALEIAFTKYKPKAVIVVNLYGTIAKYDEIIEICKKHNTPIVEDSTESLGSLFKGKHGATFGDYGCLSFNGNKIITSTGGGMLVSNNVEGIKKAFSYATQSRENGIYYSHNDIGYNYRLSNVSAAIGLGQLEKLAEKVAMKNHICNKYKEGFNGIDCINVFDYTKDRKNNNWISCLKLEDSNIKPLDLFNYLSEKDIETRFFWKPLHTQSILNKYDFVTDGENNISKKLFETCLCLPSDTNMTDEQQDFVIESIISFIKGGKNV